MVNKRVWNAVLGCNLKNDRMISVRFQGKPFNITVIQVYAPTSNADETEVERFYEDLQDLLELTPKKDVFFIIGDCNAKVTYLGYGKTGIQTSTYFYIGMWLFFFLSVEEWFGETRKNLNDDKGLIK